MKSMHRCCSLKQGDYNQLQEEPFTMKAILLPQTGGVESLIYGEYPAPHPKENEVLVRLDHSALNHVDVWVRQGSAAYAPPLPHIPGADGAGVVEALGSNAEGVSVGDRVVIIPGISCGHCAY